MAIRQDYLRSKLTEVDKQRADELEKLLDQHLKENYPQGPADYGTRLAVARNLVTPYSFWELRCRFAGPGGFDLTQEPDGDGKINIIVKPKAP